VIDMSMPAIESSTHGSSRNSFCGANSSFFPSEPKMATSSTISPT
jgi:hypothetical protein